MTAVHRDMTGIEIIFLFDIAMSQFTGEVAQ